MTRFMGVNVFLSVDRHEAAEIHNYEDVKSEKQTTRYNRNKERYAAR